jgi:hypothetical protein
MPSPIRRPRWWQLYALIPAVVVLFAAENDLPVAPRVHQVFQIAIVVVVFAFVQWWLSANRFALLEEERRQLPSFRRPSAWSLSDPVRRDPEAGREPAMFHLPPAGLRNTLSDTFEMDDVDPDSTNRRTG